MVYMQTFTTQTSQTGAPSTYIADNLISEWYVVSLAEGWSYPSGSPTGGFVHLWESKGPVGGSKVDCLIATITLPATVGDGVTVTIPGNSGNIAATVVLTAGSEPTFSGKILFDGQMQDGFPGI